MQECVTLVTVLDKTLKRQVSVDGVDYIVALDPNGIRLNQKGKRRAEVELGCRELVSGEAAMAVALNASLASRAPVKPASRPAPVSAPATSAPPAAAPAAASALAPKKPAVRKRQ